MLGMISCKGVLLHGSVLLNPPPPLTNPFPPPLIMRRLSHSPGLSLDKLDFEVRSYGASVHHSDYAQRVSVNEITLCWCGEGQLHTLLLG